MNKNRLISTSIARRATFVLTGLTIVFAGFIGLTGQSTTTKARAHSASSSIMQPNALGKLAFERTDVNTTGASGGTSLLSVNADGTGRATLSAVGTPPTYSIEPAFSPDGTRIVYVSDPDIVSASDIFVMNADGSGKTNLTITSPVGERNPSWSATNKIAYERESKIWTMNPDGTDQKIFGMITQPAPIRPAWSPDGSKMAYASGGEIWVINADGTNERRVTNNSTTDADPQWSPDGSKIIFGKGDSGIAVVNLDGTSETNLTTNALDGKPQWSSDGTRIAFVRNDGTTGGIFVMDAIGANQVKIVANQFPQPGRNINDNPAWQPTPVAPNTAVISGRITRVSASLSGVTVNLFGTTNATTTTDALGFYQFSNLPQGGNYTVVPRLANNLFTPNSRVFDNVTANQISDFIASVTCAGTNCTANGKIAYAGRDGNIYTASPDGTNVFQLTNVQRDNNPMWSPNGAKIVFESSRDILTASEIYSINADGTNLTRLTNNTTSDEYPSFSPDGTKILFASNRDGNWEIYQMNVDGTNQVRLTNDASDDRYPKYSPDGTKIVFTRYLSASRGLHTMNVDGTDIVQITAPTGANMDISGSYSPDGTKIVFIRGNGGPPSNQIYTVNSDGSNPTLVVADGFHYKTSYAPDGTKILFTTDGGLTSYVRTVSPGGSDSQTLFTGGTRADWQPIRAAIRPTPFDFDGDGRADVSVFRPDNGVWYLQQSTNGFSGTAFGLSTDKLVPADYDGDGKTDIAVNRGGVWYLQRSQAGFTSISFGDGNDVPVPADYDGDGKADIAVFRPSNGTWYRLNSSNGAFNYDIFGLGTDKPVPGDYNGDGKTEIALFRPNNGYWYLSTNPATGYGGVQFGNSEDKPVPADYDGDGKIDIAVFRPANGTWYLNRSQAGFVGIAFGLGTDSPVAADYDGDGKTDVAVVRNGTWYLNRTANGFTGIAFGTINDKPIANAFVR